MANRSEQRSRIMQQLHLARLDKKLYFSEKVEVNLLKKY